MRKIKSLCWYAFCQFYKNKKASLISIIMMAIGLVSFFYSFVILSYYGYQYQQTKKCLNYDSKQVYKINYHTFYGPVSNDELVGLFEFYQEIKSVEGVKASGLFFIQEFEHKKLNIDKNIVSLCDIKNVNGDTIEFASLNKEYKYMAITEDLKDTYKLGDVYVDPYTGSEYMISEIVSSHNQWMNGNEGDELIEFQNLFIVDVEEEIKSDLTVIYNGIKSFYLVVEDESVIPKIQDVANKKGVKLYSFISLKDYYHNKMKIDLSEEGEMIIFPIIILLAATLSIVLSTSISIYRNKNNYEIMLSNGFTHIQLYLIVIVTNLVKCTVALLLYKLIEKKIFMGLIGVYKNIIFSYRFLPIFLCFILALIASIRPCCLMKAKR